MHHVLEDFVERLFESRDCVTLQAALAEVSATLGLPFFAYLAVPAEAGDPPLLIANFPAGWLLDVNGRGCPRLEPVLRRAGKSAKPFVLGPALTACAGDEEYRTLAPAAESGIRHGVIFPLHAPETRFAALIFAADQDRAQFQRMLRGRRQLLALISLCFHGHVRRLSIIGRDPARNLSPRERECMDWAAKGKSCWEIAQILSISRRTAAFHLDNARGKLGVRTRIQAVAALSQSR